jgi:hypothetical protein
MKKFNRVVIAAFGDLHSGHELGLLNPETGLYREDREGNPYVHVPKLNDNQEYLWELYHDDHIPEVIKLAEEDEVIPVFLGDVSQGNRFHDEVMTSRMSDQLLISEANFLPWFNYKNVNTMRLTRGTAPHSYGEGSAEVTVAALLTRRFPERDIKTIYHGLADISGMKTDYAHHGPYTGSRNWLQGNVARLYLQSLIEDELDFGNEPAQLVLRAHFHSFVKVFFYKQFQGKEYNSWLIVVPSYCMLPDYARQRTRSKFLITNGMVAIEVIDGRIYQTHFFGETLDIRTKEKLL